MVGTPTKGSEDQKDHAERSQSMRTGLCAHPSTTLRMTPRHITYLSTIEITQSSEHI